MKITQRIEKKIAELVKYALVMGQNKNSIIQKLADQYEVAPYTIEGIANSHGVFSKRYENTTEEKE